MKFAFQSWYNGDIQTSALYKGQRAEEFRVSHYDSGTFATLHYGGEEVVNEYLSIINERYGSSYTIQDLFPPIPARAGKKGF